MEPAEQNPSNREPIAWLIFRKGVRGEEFGGEFEVGLFRTLAEAKERIDREWEELYPEDDDSSPEAGIRHADWGAREDGRYEYGVADGGTGIYRVYIAVPLHEIPNARYLFICWNEDCDCYGPKILFCDTIEEAQQWARAEAIIWATGNDSNAFNTECYAEADEASLYPHPGAIGEEMADTIDIYRVRDANEQGLDLDDDSLIVDEAVFSGWYWPIKIGGTANDS